MQTKTTEKYHFVSNQAGYNKSIQYNKSSTIKYNKSLPILGTGEETEMRELSASAEAGTFMLDSNLATYS